jgi:multidrug efflux pump subunit AcrA (membrane-fusion protein)
MQDKEDSMTPQEELELALAEVEALKAELAAAQAEIAADAASRARPKRTAKKAAASARRGKRPVHRSELRSGCSGTGERFTGADKMRIDMTPVVAKELNPMNRPTNGRMPAKVSVRVYDDAGLQQGLAVTMTERESDLLEASLPFGWTITSRKAV